MNPLAPTFFAFAPASVRNQFAFRHASGDLPLKRSMWPFCIGRPRRKLYASMAGYLRVKLSMIVSTRRLRPVASESTTKSIAHS